MERGANTTLTERILVVSSYAGTGSSGQHAALCRTVAGLRGRYSSVTHLILPALNRGIDGAWQRVKFLIAFPLEFVHHSSRVCLGPAPSVIVVGLGQSVASLLREGAFAWLVRLRFGAPLVVVLHSSYVLNWSAGPLKSIFLSLLGCAQRVVVLGPRMGSFLSENFANLASQPKIIEIDNQAEVEVSSQEQVTAKQRGCETVRVLYFAALFHSKGYLDFLAALKLLPKSTQSRLEILLVGDLVANPNDPERKSLAENRTELESKLVELSESCAGCTWISGQSSSDAQRFFSAANIFVLPSYSEGQPLSMINALATGCALVITPVGEIPSVVGADSALIVSPGSCKELANAIERLALDEPLRIALSIRGLEIARARFTRQIVEQRWSELLSDLIGGQSATV
jgi:glycosyltransferase involved in cell wall biosynthesis